MTTNSDTGGHRFPSTHWSAIYLASQLDKEKGQRTLDALLTRYLPALKAYLESRFHVDTHQSEDWLQGFVWHRVLEKELLSAARPERGRFRTFLLSALHNFVISQLRHEQRQKRSPQADTVPFDENTSLQDGNSASQAVCEFDRQWAQGVIQEALERMKDQCQESGRCETWEVFEGRYVGPILLDRPIIDYSTLAAQFGLKSPAQAANLLITAKRTFQRILRSVIAEYVATESEVEAELRELINILSAS